MSNARLYAYGIVGKARWAHLSTCHHIKPAFRRGLDVVTSMSVRARDEPDSVALSSQTAWLIFKPNQFAKCSVLLSFN